MSSTGASPSLGPWTRLGLAAVGLGSWAAGAVALFRGDDGAGVVALVAAGALVGVIAAADRWPTRIAVSGSEVSWEQVQQVIDTQIDAAETGDAAVDPVLELNVLRRRLDALQRTGTVPEHPAERYDRELATTLQQLLPAAVLTRPLPRSRAQADITLVAGNHEVAVETKWKSDADSPLRGTTLGQLFGAIPPGSALLVVSNSADVTQANAVVRQALGERGRVVSWQGPAQNQALLAAVRDVLPDR